MIGHAQALDLECSEAVAPEGDRYGYLIVLTE